MIRIAFVLFAAIFTGAIIHIGTIFAIPYFAQNDIWHRALSLGPLHRVHTIAEPQAAIALSRDLDPLFSYGFCRADVSASPVVMRGTLPADFWSLNYLDRQGRSQFSLTNQISGPNIHIVLATKGQQRLLAERPDLIEETAIVISAEGDQGLLVLRAFVSSERGRQKIVEAIERLSCTPLAIESRS